ncbi:LTA synthase family protein [Mesobacillus foraminis]|uniref:Lipoteichoic acid synthase n=1 Tax=Mesobacillus foraminis TaxID=279826 RepID=A0A4R2BKB9_9BACI|nr:LTA synthase family protein [Mesobacillus foraminis]TCN27426.1 lipoteichoic acid synthase [Mesobacillus foraminis]
MKRIKADSLTYHPLTFILSAIIALWLKTVAVGLIGFNLSLQSPFELLMIVFSPLGSLLLVLGISYYVKAGNFKVILFSTMTIITLLLYGDLLYYRFYTDFVTVPILFQFKNVGGLGPSTLELMSPWDLLLFADLIIFWVLLRKFNVQKDRTMRVKYLYVGISLLLTVISAGLGLVKSPHLYTASYDREQMVKTIGPYNYHLYDISLAVQAPFRRLLASKTDTVKAEQYTSSKEEKRTEYFGLAKGRNLVLISMESTQNFVINQKVDGEEITPFLNSLIKDSFYFDSIYDQTAQGKTSDSEFMIDTGLYPLSSGSVFVRKPENVFHSLPKILKEEGNFYSSVFHGNDSTFWNREQMYKSLGYDKFFSKKDYEVTEENSVNYGIKDIPFFQQSAAHLAELPEPYYARMITLTNHFPFLLDEEDKLISEPKTNQEVVNRYITTVRYQDEAIKTLFKKLKEKGMYKDTMFVLYGDHYGISEKYEVGIHQLLNLEKSPVQHAELQKVPVIIHIPGVGGKTFSAPGGEIDIRATILELLGIQPENTLSFGHELFTRNSDHPVIFRDGGFITENYVYIDNVCYEKKSGKPIEESACGPFQEKVRNELGLSDEILAGDLLRFMED